MLNGRTSFRKQRQLVPRSFATQITRWLAGSAD
jgi:hypothetical protein